MNRFPLIWALALAGLLGAPAPAAPPRAPATVNVRLQTSAGPIVVALETQRAPITAGNFLRYVDEKRFDGTTFYRAARAGNGSGNGLIQGGINHKIVRALVPIPHEPTTKTGLSHVDGALSMARDDPGTAMGDFFVTVGPALSLDGSATYPGYAVFGHVVSGMAVVRHILARPTYPGGYSLTTKGQTIRAPIRILTARRVK